MIDHEPERHEVEGRPVCVRTVPPLLAGEPHTIEATVTRPQCAAWRAQACAFAIAGALAELADAGHEDGRVEVVGRFVVAFETRRPRVGLALVRDAIHLAHRRTVWLACAPRDVR